MARTEAVTSITLIAGADLSTTGQFRFVNLDSNGDVVLAGDGGDAIGVLLNAPGMGQAAEVGISGLAKVEASAATTAGGEVASAANGQSANAASGDEILGRIVTAAGAAGELHEIILRKDGTMA